MQNTYLNQSLSFAEEVENQFSTRANRKSRGVKQAPFYVISRTNMPSILVECGFLTNPKEEEFLHTDIGQDYIASAIFRAFRSYKESIEIEDTKTSPKEVKNDSMFISKNKNVSEEIFNEPQLLFKVQIGTFLKSMLNQKQFIELDAEEIKVNETYKYYVSSGKDKQKAEKLKIYLQDIGFKGAFLVAFLDGKQISTKEALNLQYKTKKDE